MLKIERTGSGLPVPVVGEKENEQIQNMASRSYCKMQDSACVTI